MPQGYGAVDEAGGIGAEEFGGLPLADRVALLEEYHQERWAVGGGQYPSIRGVLDGASGHGRQYQQFEAAKQHANQGKGMELACMCILIGGTSFVSSSSVPIFESLRDAVGFSSMQVTMLNCAPLFFAALFTLPTAAFTQNSPVWDLLGWASASLMLGTWVSACALMGSPLEYMLCGKWFVGLSIAFLVTVPSKFAVFCSPDLGRRVANTAWGVSLLLGLGLPFLAVPSLCGGDGKGRHLGSFLLFKALLGTLLCVTCVCMRLMGIGKGKTDEEEAFYRRFHTKSFNASLGEMVGNLQIANVLLALSLSTSVGFSFYTSLPWVLSLAPANLTPLQAGWYLWGLAPAGILGILMVRAKFLLNLDDSRNYKPAILACISGSMALLIIFAFMLGRTGTVQLTLAACGFSCFCAPLLHIAAEVTMDLAYPVPEPVSAALAATLVLLASSLCPIASVWITHPMLLVYSTDADSPTGLLLSSAAIFWVALVALSFAAVVCFYADETSRIGVDTEPKLVSHVTYKVAQDLRDARAISEMVIPLPDRLHNDRLHNREAPQVGGRG